MADDSETAERCTCTHRIIRFAKFRDDMPSIHYLNADGPISPAWLTITHNVLGDRCHRGLVGYTLEYRNDDGSVITWEEFAELDDAIATATKWHGATESDWHDCDVEETGDNITPWVTAGRK
jgi:hypothetical protein